MVISACYMQISFYWPIQKNSKTNGTHMAIDMWFVCVINAVYDDSMWTINKFSPIIEWE